MRSAYGAGKKSLSRIRAALSETQDAMGVTALNDWTARYYQHANRLAVLHFLTCHSIPVVLVDVFFHGRTDSDDRSPKHAGGVGAGPQRAKRVSGTHW